MKKIKLDPSDGPTDARSKVHWGAFYSDCEHEVLEVTSGAYSQATKHVEAPNSTRSYVTVETSADLSIA